MFNIIYDPTPTIYELIHSYQNYQFSGAIGDLEILQQHIDKENRTSNVIKLILLDTNAESANFNEEDWEISRWSFKQHVKRCTIYLKVMKKLVQHNDRYANEAISQCNDSHSLCNYIQLSGIFRQNKLVGLRNTGGYSSIE